MALWMVGGIKEDGPRKRIDDDLTKLKAAVAKAKQPAPAAVATKALSAVLAAAEALRGRADRTKDAVDWAQANLGPLDAPTAAGIAVGTGTAATGR